jgi:hypothetical protein
MDRSCSQNGGRYDCFQNLTDKPTGKRYLRRPRSRWEENIRMDLEKISISERNWIDSAQDRDYWERLWMWHWTFGFHKPWSLSVSSKHNYTENAEMKVSEIILLQIIPFLKHNLSMRAFYVYFLYIGLLGWSSCMNNEKLGTIVKFKFVCTYWCVFFVSFYVFILRRRLLKLCNSVNVFT